MLLNNLRALIYKQSRRMELANRSYLFLFPITLWVNIKLINFYNLSYNKNKNYLNSLQIKNKHFKILEQKYESIQTSTQKNTEVSRLTIHIYLALFVYE